MQDDLLTQPDLVAFDLAHLPGALRLSQQAGWPHRAEDWVQTLSVSTGVVAMAGGRVVGTAICSDLGQVTALTMIVVDEAMRGRGLGRRLMNAVIRVAEGREMRLTATDEGLPLYEKLGFVATGIITQHQGTALAGTPESPVRDGDAADLDRLAIMDLQATGMQRHALLQQIAANGQLLVTGSGAGLLRRFGHGHVIGPVIADDPAAARALMTEAARRCAGGFLRVDLPARHGLSGFVETLGLAHVGGGTAMVCNAATPAPAADAPTTFALLSQALG